MRYEAKPAASTPDAAYFVEDNDHPELGGIGPVMTPAEAEICAWALNAITRGHSLLAVTGGVVKDWYSYTGPTEGV